MGINDSVTTVTKNYLWIVYIGYLFGDFFGIRFCIKSNTDLINEQKDQLHP